MGKLVLDQDIAARLNFPHIKGRQFNSFSGIDISCIIYFPSYSKSNLISDNRKKFKEFAELQTLSVSSTRSISPVRVLGRSSPLGYTRGARTYAGTLVFASVNEDVFADVYDEDIGENTMAGSGSLVSDQLPPFSIVINAANEKGGAAVQVIHGVTLVNYGTTYSIDDLYTECTYSYIATDVLPLTSSSVSLTRASKEVATGPAYPSVSDSLLKELSRHYGTKRDTIDAAKLRSERNKL